MKTKSIVSATAAVVLSLFLTSCMDFMSESMKKSFVAEETPETKDITLTFDLSGGTGTETLTGKEGSPVTSPTEPTKEGYEFAGWNPEIPDSFPSENAMYTATWKLAGDYSITYNLNGGTNATENPAGYNIETPTITLAAPTRPGYTFDGWFTTESFDEGSGVTEISQGSAGDVTLWAKWVANTYTITYNKNSGTIKNEGAFQQYTCGIGFALPTPTRAGYTFEGWFITSDFSGSSVAKITTTDFGDKSYYAKWTANTITLTLNLDGGTGVTTLTGKYGTRVQTPTSPIKDGYIFTGWSPALPSTFPIENMSYSATWTRGYIVTADTVASTIANITDTNPVLIKVQGEISTDTIIAMEAQLKGEKKINLDLSETTGLVLLGNNEDCCFRYCTSLVNVVLPRTLRAMVGYTIFYGCNITSITIPYNVDSISPFTFKNTNFTSITFENTLGWKVGDNAVDVTNPTQNASWLTEGYYDRYWTRN